MTHSLDRLKAALADRYTVERELGRGGMATVYLATDLRHDRPVALKVLEPELASALGSERFLREIQTTARLAHPHILPLLDSGDADGLLFYVMPYVAGESLRARLEKEKQLPVEDALRIAREVAGALSYAHAQGVIHRDIKPANILLEAGHAVVADFGIARAVDAAGGGQLTRTGITLGTPAYMSPEQTAGEHAPDARSDVYSLGCVLYEMLAGEPPHTGPTAQAVIAKVLGGRPRPIAELRDTVPDHVAATLDQVLARLPADRCATAAEFAARLDPGTVRSGWQRPSKKTRGGAGRTRSGAAAIALVAIGAVGGYALGARSASTRQSFDVGLPDSLPIAFAKGGLWGEGWRALAVAPGGDFVVYIADRGATTELRWHSLVDPSSHAVPGTEGVSQFALSPNGGQVAILVAGEARIVSLAGDTTQRLGDYNRVAGVTWEADDRVLIAEASGQRLVSIDLRSGARDTLVSNDDCYMPQVIDGGNAILCSGVAVNRIRVLTPTSTTAIESPDGPIYGTDARWIGREYLLWVARQGEVMAAAWRGPGARTSRPVRVLSDVRSEAVTGAAQYHVSDDGQLVFAPGENASLGYLVAFAGSAVLDTLPVPRGAIKQFDFSADGGRVALTERVADGDELWVLDVSTGNGALWLSAPVIDEPRWNPSSSRIAVNVRGVTVIGDPDANALPDTLRGVTLTPSDWAEDDLLIGWALGGSTFGSDIVVSQLATNGTTADTIRIPEEQSRAMLSPDGRLLALMSGNDVVIEDFPRRLRRYSIGRGLDPLWISSGELVIRDGTTWHWVRVDPVTGQPLGESRPAWWDPRFIDTPYRSQAVTPDGRLVYLQGSGRANGMYVRVIPGWLSEVGELVSASNRE